MLREEILFLYSESVRQHPKCYVQFWALQSKKYKGLLEQDHKDDEGTHVHLSHKGEANKAGFSQMEKEKSRVGSY